MKCVTDVVESSASVDVDPERVRIVLPEVFTMPDGGLNIRWPDLPLIQEARVTGWGYRVDGGLTANGSDDVSPPGHGAAA
ncbi:MULTISPECIES: hypothetical protein [Burkholderiaceae]|uniref:hypothetical protein n=1 Tax=Burkholderiaceae TaxID=119060 RepID=UPI00147FFFC5|nr:MULTISPECIES: hypothetical protein [Burkholderiaceae]MCF2132794.1 hypothetical protein [Mycetohabitans sp. B3]MCG1038244.1 hypothetical protein [Mycetohabitans sp. B7]